MFLIDKKFLKPTKQARVLAILENLKADSCISQHDMAKNTDLSDAMINKYLKELNTQGLIDLRPLNGKSYSYEVTAGGEEQRAGLLGQYCAEIVQIYSALKRMIEAKLLTLQAEGCSNLALFGASETCEVTLAALKNLEFKIMAIVDNDVRKQGTMFHGHIIHSPMIISALDLHAVVITSFGWQQEIYDQLQSLTKKHNKPMQIIRL